MAMARRTRSGRFVNKNACRPVLPGGACIRRPVFSQPAQGHCPGSFPAELCGHHRPLRFPPGDHGQDCQKRDGHERDRSNWGRSNRYPAGCSISHTKAPGTDHRKDPLADPTPRLPIHRSMCERAMLASDGKSVNAKSGLPKKTARSAKVK